ncbi:coenzyme F430 synthase [Methanocrinis sp.]|uniref:coenzyme F430 synthase n=1 Tax=Methanocrinis sp. TaxID=3101522 RepID=UPI003D09C744
MHRIPRLPESDGSSEVAPLVAVLDTIHGAEPIAERMRAEGIEAAALEVYHSAPDVSDYDLVVAPIHLPPGNPAQREAKRLGKRVITHHQAVGDLLAGVREFRTFEVTGTRGKTTTALILAQILSARGKVVSHTTRGIEVWRRGRGEIVASGLSITPANVIRAFDAAEEAKACDLICEVSLGGTGLADFGVLTSFAKDYLVAGGALWASTAKLQMITLSKKSSKLIASEDVRISADLTFGPGPRSQVRATEREILAGEEVVPIDLGEGLDPESYVAPISGAAAAALAAGLSLHEIASALEGFDGLGGRMKNVREGGILLLDNSNSGLQASGVEAALDRNGGGGRLALVVGEEAETVCEGMDVPALIEIIARRRREINLLVLVGKRLAPHAPGLSAHAAPDLDSGIALAKAGLERGDRLVSCVKCFR